MFPLQLEKDQRYRYSHAEIFRQPGDLVHGFVMRNYRIGMHVQQFYEINIITRGTGMHYIENRRLPVRRGDVFIIPPEMAHGYEGGQGFDVFHALLSESFMEKYREEQDRLPSFYRLFQAEPLMRARAAEPFHLSLCDEELREAEKLLQMLSEYKNPVTDVDTIRSSCLALLLITFLCETYTKSNPAVESEHLSCDEAFMEAIARIHGHYAEKITVSELSRIARLSRSAFIRKFREVCGMPPAEYLLHRRLEAARHLLLSTGLSAAEIAIRTGFYDASHFTRAFRAAEGCTPNEFRRREKEF